MAETVVFNGVKFRRYPDAKQRADRVYFTPGIADKQKGTGRLHEEIWKDAHGPIPSGGHIHHKDENPLNNAIDNLEWLPSADHMRHHHAGVCSDRKREHLDEVRHLTKVWHGSTEGLEWHRRHGHAVYDAQPEHDLACEQCGKAFRQKSLQASYTRFCSNACKSAWRRASGLDDIQRPCAICGTEFTINRYSKTKTCSRECFRLALSAAKTSSPSGRLPAAP